MENFGLGAGLAALAFWGFVATAVIAGVWDGIRKRDAQHETIRRIIESGQSVDQALMKKLSLVADDEQQRPDRDFFITGLWILPVAPGLAIMAYFLGSISAKAFAPIMGAALVACLGIGYLLASKIVGRRYGVDSDSVD